jgi:hypothetical protein
MAPKQRHETTMKHKAQEQLAEHRVFYNKHIQRFSKDRLKLQELLERLQEHGTSGIQPQDFPRLMGVIGFTLIVIDIEELEAFLQ